MEEQKSVENVFLEEDKVQIPVQEMLVPRDLHETTFQKMVAVGATQDQLPQALKNLYEDSAAFTAIAYTSAHVKKEPENKKGSIPKLSKLPYIKGLISLLCKSQDTC